MDALRRTPGDPALSWCKGCERTTEAEDFPVCPARQVQVVETGALIGQGISADPPQVRGVPHSIRLISRIPVDRHRLEVTGIAPVSLKDDPGAEYLIDPCQVYCGVQVAALG